MMKNTFRAVKTDRSGDCSKECSLDIKTHVCDVSLRWRKNKYGGIIRLNYNPPQPNEVTFAGNVFKGTGTTTIDFLNHSGFTIDSVEPDAVVHMKFMRGSTNDAEIIHILIPFVATGEQGGFPITDGSELFHSITNQLKTYQPDAGDPSTQLTEIDVHTFIPDKPDYYYAESHSGDKYIILRKIQGIKADDKNTLFSDLFDIGKFPKWPTPGGTNMDIAKYYMSTKNINVSKVYKGSSQEGFTGMHTMMPLNTSTIYEGFESANGDDEVYIDCRPVGVDEETKPVTVKNTQHEGGSLVNSKDKERLISLLIMIFGVIVFSVLLYGISKLLSTQDTS